MIVSEIEISGDFNDADYRGNINRSLKKAGFLSMVLHEMLNAVPFVKPHFSLSIFDVKVMPSIPKGLRITAQGCRAPRTTLGHGMFIFSSTTTRLRTG